MTRRISLVAVCCSSARSPARELGKRTILLLQLGEQPHVLDGDHRLVGEGLEQLDLRRRRTAPGSRAANDDHAERVVRRGASASTATVR